MAAEDGRPNKDDEDAEVEVEDRDKTRAEAAKAMDKMTALVPERQLDEEKVKKAVEDLMKAQQADKAAQLQREKELAAVKINKEDVDVIATEFEMDRKAAERKLRECNGDLANALKSLL